MYRRIQPPAYRGAPSGFSRSPAEPRPGPPGILRSPGRLGRVHAHSIPLCVSSTSNLFPEYTKSLCGPVRSVRDRPRLRCRRVLTREAHFDPGGLSARIRVGATPHQQAGAKHGQRVCTPCRARDCPGDFGVPYGNPKRKSRDTERQTPKARWPVLPCV